MLAHMPTHCIGLYRLLGHVDMELLHLKIMSLFCMSISLCSISSLFLSILRMGSSILLLVMERGGEGNWGLLRNLLILLSSCKYGDRPRINWFKRFGLKIHRLRNFKSILKINSLKHWRRNLSWRLDSILLTLSRWLNWFHRKIPTLSK